MTELAKKAAAVADQLAASLRDYADSGESSGASISLRELAEVLPAVRAELEASWRRQLAGWIAEAAGNAATHKFVVTDEGLIRCERCGLLAGGSSGQDMRLGQMPLCTDTPPCRHSLYPVYRPGVSVDPDRTCCIYCDEVFENTVEPAPAGGVGRA
jgi:hypothetical protein